MAGYVQGSPSMPTHGMSGHGCDCLAMHMEPSRSISYRTLGYPRVLLLWRKLYIPRHGGRLRIFGSGPERSGQGSSVPEPSCILRTGRARSQLSWVGYGDAPLAEKCFARETSAHTDRAGEVLYGTEHGRHTPSGEGALDAPCSNG